jgi:hypothetical protein
VVCQRQTAFYMRRTYLSTVFKVIFRCCQRCEPKPTLLNFVPPNILEHWCAVKCNLCALRPLPRISFLEEDFFFTGKGVSQDYNVQGTVSELDGRSNSVYLFFKNLLGHTVIS